MKSLIRIQETVYNKPWLILPSVHRNIQKQLENVLQGKTQLPDMPMDDEDEEEEEEELSMVSDIGVITIDGIIGKHLGMLETMCGGVDVDIVSEMLDELSEDPNINTIVMYFNTPGGTVTGVPELAEKIAEVAKTKQVIAYADVLCASAGYYLASQANAIYAAPSAELGSIGVYSIYFDESVALANEGIKVNAISAGKYKLMGAPFRPMTDEERAMLQKDVDEIYNQFKSAVTSKRPISDDDMQGQVFSNGDLITKNLIDGNINSLGELLDVLTTNPTVKE